MTPPTKPRNNMRIDRSKSSPAKLRAAPSRVATDPKMRSDHVCVRYPECEGTLTRIAIANEDPFCSAVCCRAWYDVHDPGRR